MARHDAKNTEVPRKEESESKRKEEARAVVAVLASSCGKTVRDVQKPDLP